LAQAKGAWAAASQRAGEASRAESEMDQRRESLRQQLHSLLDGLGFDRREALGAARDLIASCEATRTAQQVRTRIEQLDAQLEQLRAPGERGAAERGKADDYTRQLAAIYAPAGITDPDMERAAAGWDAGIRSAEAYRASSTRLSELDAQRGAGRPGSAMWPPLTKRSRPSANNSRTWRRTRMRTTSPSRHWKPRPSPCVGP